MVLSEGLGPAHANLIVHERFGASVGGAVAGGCGTTAGFETGLLFAPHANVIHRFLGATSTGGWAFGEITMASGSCAIGSLISTLAIGTVGGGKGLDANE